VDNLYLGPAFPDDEIQGALTRHEVGTKYELTRLTLAEEAGAIAGLLAEGHVVARFAGRMEFGARALGNRSILADPSRREVVQVINDEIKGRDFWMPFAWTVLADAADRYLEIPKEVPAPYMALAFHTRADERAAIVAGTHPYDHTVRPQVLEHRDDPRYHDLIQALERRTGTGVVSNTSFNLHGEPLVCTPDDALDVSGRSELTALQLEG
jgi:carbamoyltransferase